MMSRTDNIKLNNKTNFVSTLLFFAIHVLLLIYLLFIFRNYSDIYLTKPIIIFIGIITSLGLWTFNFRFTRVLCKSNVKSLLKSFYIHQLPLWITAFLPYDILLGFILRGNNSNFNAEIYTLWIIVYLEQEICKRLMDKYLI